MANTVFRSDLLSGTKQEADLVSVRVYDAAGTTPIAVENGVIVEIVGYEDGQREVLKAKLATAASALIDCAIVAGVEGMYDERKKNLDEYINEAGAIPRAYIPRSRNLFSVTAPGFVGGAVPAVGGALELGAGGKIKAGGTGSGTALGSCVAIETEGRYTYYTIKIGATEV
jgi:hypothetical protein